MQKLIDDGKLELLQEMYRTWPFFSVTLDMVEMVFAKVRMLAAPFTARSELAVLDLLSLSPTIAAS